jgi:hypothetical protein
VAVSARARTGLRLPVVAVLPDGTYLNVVMDASIRGGRRDRILATARAGGELDPDLAQLVRVVEYDVPDRDGNGTGDLIVLLTSIISPADACVDELADTYHMRWGEETWHWGQADQPRRIDAPKTTTSACLRCWHRAACCGGRDATTCSVTVWGGWLAWWAVRLTPSPSCWYRWRRACQVAYRPQSVQLEASRSRWSHTLKKIHCSRLGLFTE